MLSLLICLLIITNTWAGKTKDKERRLLVGLNFFPNVVAVDEDILSKRTASGKLRLLLVYENNRKSAEKFAKQLNKRVRSIKKTPIEIVVTNDPVKEFSPSNRPAGIFLTEWLSDATFKKIMRFGVEHQIIVFSPFVGDVERGATAGLYISTKIRQTKSEHTTFF